MREPWRDGDLRPAGSEAQVKPGRGKQTDDIFLSQEKQAATMPPVFPCADDADNVRT